MNEEKREMIKVKKHPMSKFPHILEVWCDKQDVDAIFALDCVTAMTPANLNYELVKTCWYHVLIDARHDPNEAMLQIEALNVEVPEVFRGAWDE